MGFRLLLAFLCAVAALSPALAEGAPLLFRVRAWGAEASILGSMHLLPPTDAWLTPQVRADLARADLVVFETPQDLPAKDAAAAAAGRLGRLSPGVRLRALLDPAGRRALEALLASRRLQPDALDGDAPWFAEAELSLRDCADHGAWEAFGVEAQIARRAPARARRGAFETPLEAVRVLADMPLGDQIASLEETVRQESLDPDAYDRLEAAFLAGDAQALGREGLLPLRARAPGAWRRLVHDRNMRWARRLVKLLRGGGRIFVVVGVGHLVGPDSLPALLRAQGLDVEGP
jgi:uncharacterized protein YbaP (TraB family)